MIDWEATFDEFGYRAEIITQKKPRVLRPKVICLCDCCSKRRIIAIRVKSEIINGQWPWRCPACVSLSRSPEISTQVENNWQNHEYRDAQMAIKRSIGYKQAAAISAKKRWEDPIYRNKLETGINIIEFIAKSRELYGNKFDYSSTKFGNWKQPIDIICCDCLHTLTKMPQKHIEHGYCDWCKTRKEESEIANIITQFAECRLHDRTVIAPYELDIYVPSHKIAIEYHGLYWHSFNSPESSADKLRHQMKALTCIDNNIKLFQIFEPEWINKQQLVRSMIAHHFNTSQSLMARKLKTAIVSNDDIAGFFTNNHLQGHRPAYRTVALLLNGEIMMAMSFSKYKDGYEIIRMATKMGYHINGGASRLLYHFHMLVGNCPIHTFADLRHSTGNVYKQLGFKVVNITKPGYFYYKNTPHNILSRQRCQKHKLAELLGDGFNELESESENMFRNGYRRVWDAGHIKLILNK